MTIYPITRNSVRVAHLGRTRIFISATFATLVLWALAIEKEIKGTNSPTYGN